MSFACVDGSITCFPQDVRQRCAVHGPLNSRNRTHPVDIPLGKFKFGMLAIVGRVSTKGPVRDTMARRILSRHQADTCRRADAACIGLRKLDPLGCKTLHVWRAISPVPRCGGVMKGDRRVLPSHVIHEKHDNVWARLVTRLRGDHAFACVTFDECNHVVNGRVVKVVPLRLGRSLLHLDQRNCSAPPFDPLFQQERIFLDRNHSVIHRDDVQKRHTTSRDGFRLIHRIALVGHRHGFAHLVSGLTFFPIPR